MVKVWSFRSSREAYDLTQSNEAIKDGDVLFVPSENLVGILYEVAWPVAISNEHGEFGQFREDSDWHELNKKYGDSIAAALRLTQYMFHPNSVC